jgi:tRNA threonylcarbamoyl adenosine modification protein YjeE
MRRTWLMDMADQAENIRFEALEIDALGALAQLLAPSLRRGDTVGLWGDLGAGKTTFARFLVQAIAGEPIEVSSPSFPLLEIYETDRLHIFHFDFYRLSGPDDIAETGYDDAAEQGLVLVEWPDRLATLPPDRLDVTLAETGNAATRDVTISGHGAFAPRLRRFRAANAFIRDSGWGAAAARFLSGDASVRQYTRLSLGERNALLMDWERQPDGPPLACGRPYSQIARLAEDVRPFVAIADALRKAGLAAPQIYATDLERGFVLLQDFGDRVVSRLIAQGAPLEPIYAEAVAVLLRLRAQPVPDALPVDGADAHHLPLYDRDAMHAETALLLDWFAPLITGKDIPAPARDDFRVLWDSELAWLSGQERGWVLRDFHSPNLILFAENGGGDRIGLIDFQDAVIGHPAYDLVSLLQDARLDVPQAVEARLFTAYCVGASRLDPTFDPGDWRRAYAYLGAQRSTKILGIFARLARRDGKRDYLRHIPRVRHYLERNLAHPSLARLRGWYDRFIPAAGDPKHAALGADQRP